MKLDEKHKSQVILYFTLGSDGFLGDKFIKFHLVILQVYLQDGDSVKGEGADAMEKSYAKRSEINGWHRKNVTVYQ